MSVPDEHASREPTFEQYLRGAAERGMVVNLMFEQRLFELVSVLHRITGLLTAENVAHELVGGLAVLVHVEEIDPEQSMLTRDVDLMIRRSDLRHVIDIAERHGFRYRHAASLDMLLYGDSDRARNAVRILFSGEKVRQTQVLPNPEIAPERKNLQGRSVSVIPIPDLIRMKLSSYRLKDQVHIQVMDAAGLIPLDIESGLPKELFARLTAVRASE